MATSTTRLVLRKPDPNPVTGDNVDAAADLNANWDKVDAAMGAINCTSGARPATPYVGQFARETDTGNVIVCTSTGPSVWAYVYGDNQTRAAAGTAIYRSRVAADSQDRLQVAADGTLLWGSGALAGDTNLYRGGANLLKTDDDFTSVGTILGANIPYRDRKFVSVATGSITFSAIPSSLRGIRITWVGRGDAVTLGQLTYIRFNGSSANVYNHAYLQTNNVTTSPIAQVAQAQGVAGINPGSSATAGSFGHGEIVIPAWDSPHAGFLGYSFQSGSLGAATAANLFQHVGNGAFTPAGPYTSITIFPQAGNWDVGSDFVLWGDRT